MGDNHTAGVVKLKLEESSTVEMTNSWKCCKCRHENYHDKWQCSDCRHERCNNCTDLLG